jgi:hypothetical protein
MKAHFLNCSLLTSARSEITTSDVDGNDVIPRLRRRFLQIIGAALALNLVSLVITSARAAGMGNGDGYHRHRAC